ncbi:MAG: hypothetical protein LKF80_02365 [Brevundimonas sp.]|jgi:hypothetical protein|uniref:hypothetical protein n=1 Tax=Brevundimonas sp. TaxID=1871086 RepID=UPI0025B8CC00|nr:hypothetical protein [Brevundimonas sp.]MCH4267227.1 hypothetical protein [Brevundimonas sp.]
MRSGIVLAAVAALVAGCSNPKAADKKNFETAINDWISKNPPCLSLPSGSVRAAGRPADAGVFPHYVEAAVSEHPMRLENQKKAAAPFEALAAAGLLKGEPTEITQSGYFAGPQPKMAVIAYTLTPEGEKAFSEKGNSRMMADPSFCYGEPAVKEIVRFTEPGEMMGMMVSQVDYTWQLNNMPEWAKSKAMQDVFPQLARDTAETLEGKAIVVLTNDGWVHEKAMRR